MKLTVTVTVVLLLTTAMWCQVSTPTASHIQWGPTLPATCNVGTGDVFFKTTATVGPNYCSALNTWTAITGGGPVTPGGSSGQFQYNNSSAFAGSSSLVVGSTPAANAGNSSIIRTFAPNGIGETLVEPSCNNTGGGNLQAGLCTYIHQGGLFNPASGGNLSGHYFKYNMYNARNIFDGVTFDKKTLSGMYLDGRFQAAGQRFGIVNELECAGAGDCFSISSHVTSGAPSPAGGDEGPSGFSVIVAQPGSLSLGVLSGNAVVSPCAVTALPNGVPVKSTGPTDTKTVNVTGSTAACSVGDWLIIDNQTLFVDGGGSIEAVQIVSKTSTTITALFQNTHANGTPVNDAPVLAIASSSGPAFGQGRIFVDLDGPAYTTGTIASASGVTITGSGTSWNGLIAALGTDSKLPGCISFTTDNTTNWPSGATLRSWYPIKSVDSNTQITLATFYNLPPVVSGSTAYVARSCDQTVAIAMSYGTTSDSVTGLVMRNNAATWTNAQNIEQSISPYQEYGKISQNIWGAYTAVKTPPDMIRTLNIGNYPAASAFRVVASYMDDSTHAGYRGGIGVEANTIGGQLNMSGRDMAGTSLTMHTFADGTNTGKFGFGTGDPEIISWSPDGGTNGAGRANMGPNTTTGHFVIDASNHSQIDLISSGLSSNLWTLDYSPITDNRTITVPDASGQMSLYGPGPLDRTLPAGANSYVNLGTFANVISSTFDISVSLRGSSGCRAKNFHFAVNWLNIVGTWNIVPAITDTGSCSGSTDDFSLDVFIDGGFNVTYRVRNLTANGPYGVRIGLYINDVTATQFTPSTTSGSVSAPTAIWPSAVVTQVANTAILTNATGFAATLDPTSLTASKTFTLPNASGTFGLVLTGTTGSISGGLTIGVCDSGTATVTGAAVGMAAVATPTTYPGDGTVWNAYVSSANTVTVKLCGLAVVTPTASVYNVRVIQ